VGRREFTTKRRVRVCGRRAVSLRAADQGIEGLLTARSGLVSFARHRAGSSSTNSTVGHLAQRARGSAATISVDCSHVSAHPMPDEMAKLISRACNHAVFAPEPSARESNNTRKGRAQKWTVFTVGWHRTRRLHPTSKLKSTKLRRLRQKSLGGAMQ
jgi:hypothetical protein